MTLNRRNLIARFMNMRTRTHGFVWSIVGDYHAAEDVFQETSIIVLEKYDKYKEGTNFEAWVMEVARRTALNHRRKLARCQVAMPDRALDNLQNAFASIESDEELQDRRAALRKCIEKLHSVERKLIESRYLKHLSLKDLASVFSGTVEAIRSRIRRLRKGLFECVTATLRRGGLYS